LDNDKIQQLNKKHKAAERDNGHELFGEKCFTVSFCPAESYLILDFLFVLHICVGPMILLHVI